MKCEQSEEEITNKRTSIGDIKENSNYGQMEIIETFRILIKIQNKLMDFFLKVNQETTGIKRKYWLTLFNEQRKNINE